MHTASMLQGNSVHLRRGESLQYHLAANGLTNNGKLRPGDKARRAWPKGETIPLRAMCPPRVCKRWQELPGGGWGLVARESGGKPVEYHKEHVAYVVAFNAAARATNAV